MLQDVLHDVIPILTAAKPEEILINLSKDGLGGLEWSLLKDFLDYPAPIWVKDQLPWVGVS